MRVENLIVKNGEIQGKAESDGMRGRHVLFADIEGFLVGVFWFVNGSWGKENYDNDDQQINNQDAAHKIKMGKYRHLLIL